MLLVIQELLLMVKKLVRPDSRMDELMMSVWSDVLKLLKSLDAGVKVL